MNKRENRELIQDALDSALSGLQDDPWLAQRVIAEAKGEKSVKRKISYGLMLALLLVLAAVTALAAVVLSGKDFVGQYMAPLSENTNSETWSREELQYIERIARENDLPLTDDIVAEFNAEDEVFKETLMRLFMNMELGDSPASWPLADQAWYDELLVRYGLAGERTRFLPMEGEITEADAISVAIKYAQDHWGIDLSDALGYRRYALPDETDITPEEALATAKEWATKHGWLDEWLEWCKHSVSYRVYEGEQPVYRVCFKLRTENREAFYRRKMPFGFVVYIDPTTGTVSESIVLNELDAFERYCEFPDPHDKASDPGNG